MTSSEKKRNIKFFFPYQVPFLTTYDSSQQCFQTFVVVLWFSGSPNIFDLKQILEDINAVKLAGRHVNILGLVAISMSEGEQ